MSKFFYSRLALNNIKKNKTLYIPFILSTIFCIAMLYNMASLYNSPNILSLPGGDAVMFTLALGYIVVNIFVFIFIFYTYSFVIKRRKKEYGLFMILGMEKKHLFKVAFLENIYLYITTMTIGLLTGIVFNKLIYLLLAKILNNTIALTQIVTIDGILNCLFSIGIIFILVLLFTMKQIQFTKLVDLLLSTKQAEKEPKSKWISAILGVLCILGGYAIAVGVKDPIVAIVFFFVAVILVIIGTYLCFTSFSIIILKALRKNKKFYYKPSNYLNVSMMLYRMKQNAVGLANICILSTMVIVMLSSTTALWTGLKGVVDARYPQEILIEKTDSQSKLDYQKAALATNDYFNLTPINYNEYEYLNMFGIFEDDTFYSDTSFGANSSVLIFIELSDYIGVTGQTITTKENEVLLYSYYDNYSLDKLNYLDYHFDVSLIDEMPISSEYQSYILKYLNYVVLPSNISLEDLVLVNQDTNAKDYGITYAFSYDLPQDYPADEYVDYFNTQASNYTAENFRYIRSKTQFANNQLSLNGSFFFIGIFLSFMFIIACTIILFYKQISEGYDDKERFDVMQKVGLSQSLIKKTINAQTLTLFFLPIIVALIHTFFAFSFIYQILFIFGIISQKLLLQTTIVSFLLFVVFYFIVYKLTARKYYQIVKK